MRFLDVKTDYAFKKVFGSDQSKDVLLSFLNAVLQFPKGNTVTDLQIVDPYQMPLLKGMKETCVDVKAVLSDGSTVIVEMQVLNYEGFEKRVLYNTAKAYSTQLLSGEDYHLLNPVIALTITDFVMFPEFTKVASYFRLREKDEPVEYSRDVELVFLELPKFAKSEDELETLADKWLYFLKNAGRLDCVPATLATEASINKAFVIANEAGLTKEELEDQHRRKDFIYSQRRAMETAENRGRLEGREEGLEEGLVKGHLEGGAALLAHQLVRRFGPLPENFRAMLQNADEDTLLLWGDRVLAAACLDEVLAK